MTTTSRSTVNAVRLTALVLLLAAVAIAADLAWMAPGRIPVHGSAPVAQAHSKSPTQSSNERADRHYEKTAAAQATKNFAN